MLGKWKSRRRRCKVRWTPSWPSAWIAPRISWSSGEAGGIYSRLPKWTMSSTIVHGAGRVPAVISAWRATRAGSFRCAWRRQSTKSKRGPERASSAPSSVSRLDSASATAFAAPGLYSMEKSNPSSLPTQWFCGIVARRWSSRYLRL